MDIVLSEIHQTEQDKYCMIPLMCGIEKIQQTSEYDGKEADTQKHKWRGKHHVKMVKTEAMHP